MKTTTGSLLALAASLLGPEAVSAATTYSPPTIRSWTDSSNATPTLYKLAYCSTVQVTAGTAITAGQAGTAAAITLSKCGQQAADDFCGGLNKGTATSFTFGYTGYQKVYMQYSGYVCDPTGSARDQATPSTGGIWPGGGYDGCLGFTSITCSTRRLRGTGSQEGKDAVASAPVEAPAPPRPIPETSVP